MISTESMVFVFNAILPPFAWMHNKWYREKKKKALE
jgi:hypothetical protein